jgi:outer membrane protein OmpA-like peptidoglycan-associated protein
MSNSFSLEWKNFLPNPQEIYLTHEKPDTEAKDAYLKVKFCDPQKANKVIIAENYSPGSITKVFLYDEKDKEYLVYSGEPKSIPDLKRLWQINFPFTTYKVAAVKIEAKPTFDKSWNSIDAIGIGEIVGEVQIPKHIENLGYNVNSKYSDLGPKISADGKSLYFTREADPSNIGASSRDDDQDVWISTIDETGNWTEAKNIGRPVNNEKSNWPISISPDEQVMYVSGRYDRYGAYIGRGLSYYVKNNTGAWSKPTEVKIEDYYTETSTSDIFLSDNKKYILFGINPKTDKHHDLYVSILKPDGTYSKPKSLGKTLNTNKTEFAPFLASDNVTLYFSSDGHGGYGSNDIFVTRRLDDSWEKWSAPVNLGIEVNSASYDSDFSISAKGDYAYLTSSNDTYGNGDIVRVKLKDEIRPNPVVLIKGRVLNKKTNQPVGAEIIYEMLSNGNIEGTANSDPKTGAYKVVLPYGINYGYRASANGFYPISENLDLTTVSKYQEIEKDLYLVPIEKGETFRLNNIFFDTAKYDLLPTSNAELNRLVSFLEKQPKIKIEISGHTDNVGSDESNMTLSNNRAESVVNYLVSKGINKNRLSYKGYGETKPEATNDTDEGRQYNRRVSFTILEN